MSENILQVDFDEVLKKPSSNKIQAKRFLAKYSKPYVIEGIILPENFELKINKKKNSIRLIDRTEFDNPRIAYAVDIEVTNEKINKGVSVNYIQLITSKKLDFTVVI